MIKKLTYELNVVCQHFTKVLQHLVNIFISLSYKFGNFSKFFLRHLANITTFGL